MTKDEIIKLAHKAGFLIDTHAQQYQPNCILSTYGLIDENLQRFANLVAEREREACAKLVHAGTGEPMQTKTLVILKKERKRIAAAIRARGNT